MNTSNIITKEEGRREVADEGKGLGSNGSGVTLPTQSVSPTNHPQVAAVPSAQLEVEGLTVPQNEDMDTGVADEPPRRKKLGGSVKRKPKRQAENTGTPATPTSAPAAGIEVRKRRKGPKDTPPGGAAKPTKRHTHTHTHKPVRPPVDTEPSGAGLSSAHLTVVVTASGYPESVLTAEQFELFRENTWRALERVPPNQWPRFETAFCRGRGGSLHSPLPTQRLRLGYKI